MPSPRKKSNPTLTSDLPEEVIADILSRLPGKYVLRFRAVCKAWLRITTDPHFLAAHMRRRPLELVLCTLLEERPLSGDQVGSSRDLAFDSIPVTAADPADQRRLIRYPGYYTSTPADLTYFGSGNFPIASCAGVFLFRLDTRYAICNPVTRQWTELPQLPKRCMFEYGLYFHRPSGEFRFLCRSGYFANDVTEYYITSTGATEPRLVISTGDVDEAANKMIRWIGNCTDHLTHVVLQDRLHWKVPSSTGDCNLVVFDTLLEMFHLMSAPPMSSKCSKLFDMNQRLAMVNFGLTHIDLWFLEDYNAGEWVHRHQIVTPPTLTVLGDPQREPWSNNYGRITAASDDADEVILGKVGSLMVYNVRTKAMRALDFICEDSWHGSGPRHLFRESLMPHVARSSAGHPLVQFG
ncbi:hypothetical protein PR202_gb09050 [Eleusine coracana subsp. coracana]|uniref:F-box domain-containing protein n=1 Tax=Eleusine coracana subsp. coracana TaxID=191504 RepID=A0AAV5EGT9_ELECO|nr:hypothetical protein QOZ80_2BG0192850 [Eleusine coracana subsp. coracana]GJN21563.1 hypothetical protein PR202_gb09050 [Eleusine coracana subsp. coracana]